jgi:5-methylthioadenosine/S-adenosylhomocysteine deaminase
MGETLIENGYIATMDKNRTVYREGSILIEDDVITEIGDNVRPPRSPEHVIDARHKVALPGFVNVHCHLQQYFRGVYELIGDFYKVNLPLEGYRRPEDMEWLGPASCAEFIHGGCTTAMVVYTYPDGFAKSVAQAGFRAILGADIEEVDLVRLMDGVYDYLPEKGEAAYKRAVDLHWKWEGEAEGRITTIVAPKAADLALPETYIKCKDLAEEHGLRMTTHLSQSWREVTQVEKLYSKTPPQHLKDLGILNDKLTGAHCTYSTEQDLKLIAEAGMGILHCRAVTNPLLRWLDTGIPVGLGTDDYYHDMLQLLRQNLRGQRTRARLVGGSEAMLTSNSLTARPSPRRLLELATRGGAETLGIADKVGSLEPGKKADVILVDMLNPLLTPTMDPLTSIALYGTSDDISMVIVDGNTLKHDKKLTTINLREALTKAQGRVEEIIERFFADNPDQRKNWEKRTRKPNQD